MNSPNFVCINVHNPKHIHGYSKPQSFPQDVESLNPPRIGLLNMPNNVGERHTNHEATNHQYFLNQKQDVNPAEIGQLPGTIIYKPHIVFNNHTYEIKKPCNVFNDEMSAQKLSENKTFHAHNCAPNSYSFSDNSQRQFTYNKNVQDYSSMQMKLQMPIEVENFQYTGPSQQRKNRSFNKHMHFSERQSDNLNKYSSFPCQLSHDDNSFNYVSLTEKQKSGNTYAYVCPYPMKKIESTNYVNTLTSLPINHKSPVSNSKFKNENHFHLCFPEAKEVSINQSRSNFKAKEEAYVLEVDKFFKGHGFFGGFEEFKQFVFQLSNEIPSSFQ